MAWFSNPRVSNMKNFLSMKLLIQSLQKIYKYWNQLPCFQNGSLFQNSLVMSWAIYSGKMKYLIQSCIFFNRTGLGTKPSVKWSFDHLRLIWLSLNKKSMIQNLSQLKLDWLHAVVTINHFHSWIYHISVWE